MTTPETRSIPSGPKANDLASVLDNAERGARLVDQTWICQYFNWTMEQLDAYIKTGFPRAVKKEGTRYLWDAAAVIDWQTKNRPQSTAPPAAAQTATHVPPPIGAPAGGGAGAAVALDAEEQVAAAQISGPGRSPESRLVSPDDMLMRHAAASSMASTPTPRKVHREREVVTSRSDVNDAPAVSKREYKQAHRGWRRADYKAHGELPPASKWPVPFLLILVVVGAYFGYKTLIEQPEEAVYDPNTKTAWEQRLEEVRQELLARVEKLDGQVKELNTRMGGLETEVGRIDGELSQTQDKVAQHQKDIDNHQAKIDENTGEIETLREKNVELVRDFDRNREEIEQNQERINQLETQNDVRERQQADLVEQMDSLSERQAQLEAQRDELVAQIETLRAAANRNTEQLLDVAQKMLDFEQRFNEQTQINEDLQKQLDAQRAEIERQKERMQSLEDWAREHGYEPPEDPNNAE